MTVTYLSPALLPARLAVWVAEPEQSLAQACAWLAAHLPARVVMHLMRLGAWTLGLDFTHGVAVAAVAVLAFVVSKRVGLAVHELGHVVCGVLLGQRVTLLRLGAGPQRTLGTVRGCTFVVGLSPHGARVEFARYPDGRAALAMLYAGGAAATAIAGVAVWWLPDAGAPSPACDALRGLASLVFALQTLANLTPRSPDGAALRALARGAALPALDPLQAPHSSSGST